MLPNLEPHVKEPLFQGAHLITLVAVNVAELRVRLGEFKDVVERERVTQAHDIIVANVALVEINHGLIHLEFLLNVKAQGDHSHSVFFVDGEEL